MLVPEVIRSVSLAPSLSWETGFVTEASRVYCRFIDMLGPHAVSSLEQCSAACFGETLGNWVEKLQNILLDNNG